MLPSRCAFALAAFAFGALFAKSAFAVRLDAPALWGPAVVGGIIPPSPTTKSALIYGVDAQALLYVDTNNDQAVPPKLAWQFPPELQDFNPTCSDIVALPSGLVAFAARNAVYLVKPTVGASATEIIDPPVSGAVVTSLASFPLSASTNDPQLVVSYFLDSLVLFVGWSSDKGTFALFNKTGAGPTAKSSRVFPSKKVDQQTMGVPQAMVLSPLLPAAVLYAENAPNTATVLRAGLPSGLPWTRVGNASMFGNSPSGMFLTPDGKKLWWSDTNLNQIVSASAADLTTGMQKYGGVKFPNHLALDSAVGPSSERIIVAARPGLFALDTSSESVIRLTLPLGSATSVLITGDKLVWSGSKSGLWTVPISRQVEINGARELIEGFVNSFSALARVNATHIALGSNSFTPWLSIVELSTGAQKVLVDGEFGEGPSAIAATDQMIWFFAYDHPNNQLNNLSAFDLASNTVKILASGLPSVSSAVTCDQGRTIVAGTINDALLLTWNATGGDPKKIGLPDSSAYPRAIACNDSAIVVFQCSYSRNSCSLVNYVIDNGKIQSHAILRSGLPFTYNAALAIGADGAAYTIVKGALYVYKS